MADLDRLVNAVLLPGFHGDEPAPWVLDGLDHGLAGVVLYGHNIAADDDVRRLATAVRDHTADALVAVDEEGGDVTRLHYRSGSAYPGNLALGVVDDVALTRSVAVSIGADLRAAGVTYDLAPSVDVNSDPRNPVIGVRSFGTDPQQVAAHGVAFVEGLQGVGVAAAVKHFPGHGATVADSHHELPVVDADLATFRRRELPPFVAAVEAGVASIMTSHVLFPALDDRPATLSRRLLTGLLRDELGYDGVVVTDALDMAGVRERHGIDGAAVLALAAGADLLLIGSVDGAAHCAAIRAGVATAVDDGTLPLARLEQAAERVARMRAWLRAQGPAPAPDASAGLVAARRAVHAVGALPLTAPAVVVELHDAANLAVGEAAWGLAAPMAAYGGLRDTVVVTAGGPGAQQVAASAAGAPLVVAVRDAYRSPWQREWVVALLAARTDAVLVALGMPDDAALAGSSYVLAYGAGRVNAIAAAEALTGAS